MMGKDVYHRRTFAGPIRLGATDPRELRDCIEYSQLLSSDVPTEVSEPFLPDFTACLIRSPRDSCIDLPSSLALSSNAASERSKVQRGTWKPLTFIPKDCIRVATSLPILPRPRIPSVFPFSSVPMNCNQTGKRQRRPSQDQEWGLGAEPKWAGQGKATAYLLPVPSAIFHRSRRLGNLPGRTQPVQWVILNMESGQHSIATICQSFSWEPHSLTRGMGAQVQGHCV